ncbi:hypothetical protein TSTA_048070 [Talaromyces stipitatus ATCC 10500]|uniref:F-box domain-containing protein n=1 Tax=Talaromyces stipitatus (strain ATCC 10500 / CBS 375.48 / QM 6759 / NRRL 1006) TaxID=441959 RepID=B8MKK8_TALSN|nr:uncharacterized protein TSTA_048070 [Talaromyces stipitatus ATCC 10500]EED15363.1 hypothetical protein TSTA_048070 [Talaromyces stipitatus ATCC 10500]
MPDPMQLPHELRLMIMNHATDEVDRMLCNMSLVSKRWHAILIEQIYSCWQQYAYNRNPISSMWKFLRTILSNRQIADTVREIRYSSFELSGGRYSHSSKRPTLSRGDYDMIQKAICRAGLDHLKPYVIEAINNADPRPLLALLLANLRNLQTLHACLPDSDVILAEVFREAVKCKQNLRNGFSPLHNLREVYLDGMPWVCNECKRSHHIHVTLLWPIFQLPAIHRVSVSNFKPHEGASRAKYSKDFGYVFEASTVTDLNLAVDTSSNPCLGTPDSFILFALPKRLARLSVYLKGYNSTISNTDIWNAIQPYEGSIEYLDIDRHDHCRETDNSKLGSMRGFKRLERLYIQPRLLNDKDSLGDTLPPNCQSLNFYFDGRFSFSKTFIQQLQDFIPSTHLHVPNLWHIVLDRSGYLISRDFLLYDQMEDSCTKYGIKFEAKLLSKYGKGPRHW